MTSPNGRYFINDQKPLPRPNYHEQLIESLTRINLYNPPVQTCSTGWKFQGFFQGPTSIAYLFYRLSIIYPDLEFKGQSLLDWAQAYLALTPSGPKLAVESDHCGIANETLASLALNSIISEDASFAQQLCSYKSIINSDEQPGSDEWLYGRAGYLYFLRLVKHHFQSHHSLGPIIDDTIEQVIERILHSPRPWTWHGQAYLGAAHGSIGILTQLMLSLRSNKILKRAVCEESISGLIKCNFESGNFPSSLGASEQSDELVQFCHGAPGFIMALESIVSGFRGPRGHIRNYLKLARIDVWRRGLLTKTPCLCHGIAGNALALKDEEQFSYFLAHMTSEQLEGRGWLADAGHSDQFAGLFGGEAGRAWVWTVADKGLPKMCIGFNDL